VTWYQLVVALVLLIVCGELGKRYGPPSAHTCMHGTRALTRAGAGVDDARALRHSIPALSFITPFQFRALTAQQVAPLTAYYVGMLVFNNVCLQYVEVTFYQVRCRAFPPPPGRLGQRAGRLTACCARRNAPPLPAQVARSLSILFNILFTYTILGKPTSRQAIIACLVILLGFVVGSYGEINFSWIGILSGVASSCFVALYGIYVKKTLAIVENNEWCVVCPRRPTGASG